jgi:hypothetical protein
VLFTNEASYLPCLVVCSKTGLDKNLLQTSASGLNLCQDTGSLFYANTFRELSLETIHQNRQQLNDILS